MKIRASELGLVMATDAKDCITAKQLVTLEGLLERITLTKKQASDRDVLIEKRDAPPALSTGAKTFLFKKAYNDAYGITDNIENKYLDKGILSEDAAIDLAGSVLDWGSVVKNDEYFENDYIHGTPDVISKDFIADIKCAWSTDTFFKHLLETRIVSSVYYWQLQAYMMLTGKEEAYLIYCLINTPEHLFNKELENVKWRTRDNMDVLDLPQDIEDDIYNELYNKHHFDFMADDKRIKTFKIEASKADQNKIIEKVTLAQEYYKLKTSEL
jgi:hypothetical protein